MRLVGPRTIRARLTLTTMLVMGALLALVALAVDLGARQTLLNSVDQDLRQRSEAQTASILRRMRRPPRTGAATPRPPAADNLRSVQPRLLPGGPNPISVSSPPPPYDPAAFARALRGEDVFSTIQIEGEPVRVFSRPVTENGQVRAVLQSPYPLGDIVRSLSNLRRILLTVVVPLGAVLAGAAGLYLVGRLMKPLRSITENAETIGGANLARRLPVVGRDEFAAHATTLNRMLDRLEAAFRQEQEAAQQQRRFTADASHELKTPLAVIKGNASVVLESADLQGDDREALVEISEAAERMNRLVRDLLVLARADAGHLDRGFEPCEMGEVVRKAAGLAPGADGRVEVVAAEQPLVVRGTEEDLTRVFVNLIENAIKHAKSTGPVHIELAREDEWAVAKVSDRGIGIAEEHLPHLFERFYRTDESRVSSTGGSGLGLAICKGIVEAHHGRIEVSSEVGAGSTFTVRLPLA